MTTTVKSDDGKTRCHWCSTAPEFDVYHDEEWGHPVEDDIHLFEKLCLESFQSGLSWRTILVKRDNFRAAFAGFDYKKVALFDEKDIERLLNDKGIVRHRGKIEAVINNAKRAIELVEEEGSLASYFWSYEPKEDLSIEPQTVSTSAESIALSKALKKKGWKFLGPTTIFAFMQSMGLVNDHATDCFLRRIVDEERKNFTRPSK